MRILVAVALAAALVAPACASGSDARAGAGGFSYDALLGELRTHDAAAEPGDTLDHTAFNLRARTIVVHGETVQVFELASGQEAAERAATVSEDGSTVGTGMYDWVDRPHFFTRGRVIALYVGSNEEVVAALRDTMGPPFAGGDAATGSDPDEPVGGPTGGGDGPAAEPTPSPVTPQPGMSDVRARPWEDVEVGSDDRTLTVAFWSGIEPCYVLDRVEVVEASETVTVTLFEGHDPADRDTACIEIGVYKSVTVKLSSPLDGRRIVDGA